MKECSLSAEKSSITIRHYFHTVEAKRSYFVTTTLILGYCIDITRRRIHCSATEAVSISEV